MRTRIALSLVLALSLSASCAPDPARAVADDEPVAAQATALEEGAAFIEPLVLAAPTRPCGVWVAYQGNQAAAIARYEANPSAPDIEQIPQPGGLSCIDALMISWVLYPTNSYVTYVGPSCGIGTSPSGCKKAPPN